MSQDPYMCFCSSRNCFTPSEQIVVPLLLLPCRAYVSRCPFQSIVLFEQTVMSAAVCKYPHLFMAFHLIYCKQVIQTDQNGPKNSQLQVPILPFEQMVWKLSLKSSIVLFKHLGDLQSAISPFNCRHTNVSPLKPKTYAAVTGVTPQTKADRQSYILVW